jgi:two-component system sensor histidine kinase EvgS
MLNHEDALWLEQKWLLPPGSVSSARNPPSQERLSQRLINVCLPEAPSPWVRVASEGKYQGVWVSLMSQIFPSSRFALHFMMHCQHDDPTRETIQIVASQTAPDPQAQTFDVLHWGIISPDSAPLVSEPAMLQAKRLTILRNSPLLDLIRQYIPDGNLVEVDNFASALALIKAGGADGMVGETLALSEAIKSLNTSGIQLAPLDVPSIPLWFIAKAANQEDTEFIRQVLTSVTPADIQKSRNQPDLPLPGLTFSHRTLWLTVMCVISFGATLVALTGWAAATQQRRQRERDTETLRTTLSQWQTLVNTAPVPLFACDPAGQVVQFNTSFRQEKFLSHVFEENMLASDLPLGKLAQQMALPARLTLLNTPTPVRGETSLEDGTTLLWWLCRYTDSGNNPQGIVGGWVDISEKAALTQALNHALLRAEQASEAKSLFLARMSHDIRTPLHAILGMLEIERENNHAVEVAWQAAITLRDLIGDILDLARIEAGELRLNQEPHSLSDMLKVNEAIFSQSATTKGLVWQSELLVPDNDIFVFDKTRLNQIITNLLGNAIKYTAQGSVGFYVHYSDSQLLITITDTGVGISSNALSKLGQAWFQVDHRTPQSSGLGLTICNQLVALMAGTLHITSEPGRGTEVTVALPLSRSEQQHLPPACALPAILPRRHILVVDDFPLNLTVIRLQLEKLDQEVTCCDTPAAALTFLSQQPVDVLITDCQMPDMDGYQLVQTLLVRDMLGQAYAPGLILGCTANALPQEDELARHAGMDNLLRKPLLSANLHQALEQNSYVDKPDLSALNALANKNDDILLLMHQQIQDAVIHDIALLTPLPDPQTISKIAHRLKSSWNLTGIRQAQRCCQILESLPALLADGIIAEHEIVHLVARFGAVMNHSLTLLSQALDNQKNSLPE